MISALLPYFMCKIKNLETTVTNLSYQENEAWERSEGVYKQQERDASKMMYSFWRRGWIEIREIDKKRENGHGNEYIIRVRLRRIVEYFGEQKQTRSARPKYLLSGQKMPAPA